MNKSSGEQAISPSEASAGNAGLDELSLALARQRELETERDDYAAQLEAQILMAVRADHRAETRQRELEEALREILDGLIASRDDIGVDDWIEIAEAALLAPKTGGDHE